MVPSMGSSGGRQKLFVSVLAPLVAHRWGTLLVSFGPSMGVWLTVCREQLSRVGGWVETERAFGVEMPRAAADAHGVPKDEKMYGVLDGQHRVTAAQRLGYASGKFALLHPNTPKNVLAFFGRRNDTTGAGVRSTQYDRLWNLERHQRDEFARLVEHTRLSGGPSMTLRDYLRLQYRGLDTSTFDEFYNLSLLCPQIRARILYVRAFSFFEFAFIWFAVICLVTRRF